MRDYYYGHNRLYQLQERVCILLICAFNDVRVTAIVLRTLHEMIETEWSEDVYIPIALLNKIATWLAARQNKTTGMFTTDEQLYNRNMQVRCHVKISDTNKPW